MKNFVNYRQLTRYDFNLLAQAVHCLFVGTVLLHSGWQFLLLGSWAGAVHILAVLGRNLLLSDDGRAEAVFVGGVVFQFVC
jgi:hypothetical protein